MLRRNKTGRVQTFLPTEDMEADLKTIKGVFEGIAGINPGQKYITLES
jgi:hypothetical protein